VVKRSGRSNWGCLFTAAVVGALGYAGIQFGEVYLRFYQFRDAITQDVGFADHKTDDDIRRHLRAFADSLGLPDDARRIGIRRHPHSITVWSEYQETVDLKLFRRVIPFNITVDGDL
jgi:hypothetical protein